MLTSPTVKNDGLIALIESYRNMKSVDWNQFGAAIHERLKISAHRIAGHSDASASFGATSLTSETFLRLVKADCLDDIRNVSHFFSYLGVMMQNIFIDHHRQKNAWKNGGRAEFIPFELVVHEIESSCDSSLDEITEAIEALQHKYPRQADAIRMQVYMAMEVKEIAAALSVAVSTAESDLRFAKAFLRKFLSDE